jgi:hypothetical protein
MRGANFESNALYYKALLGMSEIARYLGKPPDETRWNCVAEKVKDSMQLLYWNPRSNIYVDSVLDGRQSTTVTEVANGMALRYGIAATGQTAEIVRQITDPHSTLAQASPLFFNYVVEGLMKAGSVEAALTLMRNRFSAMMEFTDAPTIWEYFEPYLRGTPPEYKGQLPSLVHTGGVGSAWTMSRHVLGISPEGPGFQKCRIQPRTGNLEWARGVFPSEKGEIKVNWKREKQKFILDTDLPAGLETSLVLDRDASKDQQLTHNTQQFEIRAGVQSGPDVQLSSGQVTVRVTGGSHHLVLVDA